MKKTSTITKFIRSGEHIAEVEVQLCQDDRRGYDTLSLADVRKLERVRKALVSGDLQSAMKESKLYRLAPMDRADQNPTRRAGTDAA